MSSSRYMSKKQVAILLMVGILGGTLLGGGSTYIFLTQNQKQPVDVLDLPSIVSNGEGSFSLPGDGVYLVDGNKPLQISPLPKNQPIDINVVPTIKNRDLSIAIQGNALPIGQMVLRRVQAGFGIDADFSELGATAKSVFDGSPAQQAGIQPSDVIVKVDGERPKPPFSYMPGHVDIFGPMEPSIEVEFVRGTTSHLLNIPRTYIHPTGPFADMLYPSAEKLTVVPKGSFVILTPDEALKPGVYRLEVKSNEVQGMGDLFPSSATATPSPVPPESTFYYWVFLVSR